MPEITVNIPEDKVEFFYQLLDEMGLKASEYSEPSEAQQQLVRERMADYDRDPSGSIDLESYKKKFE